MREHSRIYQTDQIFQLPVDSIDKTVRGGPVHTDNQLITRTSICFYRFRDASTVLSEAYNLLLDYELHRANQIKRIHI